MSETRHNPDNTCARCQWFDGDGAAARNRAGLCRRFPPQNGHTTYAPPPLDEVVYAIWPAVRVTDWCGDWLLHADLVPVPA